MLKKIVVVQKETNPLNGEKYISYQFPVIADYVGAPGERALSHSFLMDSMRKLMGKTLTIIDSSIVEPRQNKAMKDLIRAVYNEELSFISEFGYDQKVLQKSIDRSVAKMDDMPEAVGIEEVLGVEDDQ